MLTYWFAKWEINKEIVRLNWRGWNYISVPVWKYEPTIRDKLYKYYDSKYKRVKLEYDKYQKPWLFISW